MSKNPHKVSPIKLRSVLLTIAKIASKNSENEDNAVLTDIYKIAHSYSGYCGNLHEDWRKEADEIEKQLKDY